MTNHMETARQLRARTDVHFNCCQSVLVSFAADLGLTEEQAFALGSNFGAGMRMGSACGALTGALMALGLMGCDEKKAAELLRRFRTAGLQRPGGGEKGPLRRTGLRDGPGGGEADGGVTLNRLLSLQEGPKGRRGDPRPPSLGPM